MSPLLSSGGERGLTEATIRSPGVVKHQKDGTGRHAKDIALLRAICHRIFIGGAEEDPSIDPSADRTHVGHKAGGEEDPGIM